MTAMQNMLAKLKEYGKQMNANINARQEKLKRKYIDSVWT